MDKKKNPAIYSTKSKKIVPKSDELPKEHVALAAKHGYTARRIEPAKEYNVLSVAKAMHREEFGGRVQKLFQPETDAVRASIESGIYIGFRIHGQNWDCHRLGDVSRCFCGHVLGEHEKYTMQSIKVRCKKCPCAAFAFMATRPEDIGEFWHQRRRNFDVTTWRAKCKCKHTHVEHDPLLSHRCKKCSCGAFHSDFLCAACDRHWEEHQTFFMSADERLQLGMPIGEDYIPFAELPNMRNMVLTGKEDDNTDYMALATGPNAIPLEGRKRKELLDSHSVGNDAVFKPGGNFRPTYD